MAIHTFSKEELIEVNGMKVVKEWAFPGLTTENGNALMMRWNSSQWCVYGWCPVIDGANQIAGEWEPMMEGSRKDTLNYISEVMNRMENWED